MVAEPAERTGRVDLRAFYQRASVIWRPVRHDGLSFMVREALGHGRHVLYSYSFPGCIQVRDTEAARAEIERLHQLHRRGELGINEPGLQFVSEKYDKTLIRREILRRLSNLL